MRRSLLLASSLYLGLLIAGGAILPLLPTFEEVGHVARGCYLTDAMLPYVACRGIFRPAMLILNLPYFAFYYPVLAVYFLRNAQIGGALYFLAGTLLLWAPVAYLAWQGLRRLPPRIASALGLLGLIFGLAQIFFPGWASAPTPGARNAAAGNNGPPQLWSDHKRLSMPVGACADLAVEALKALEFSGVTRNGNYSYGNFRGNRATVKCVEAPEGSFVYFAVAGPDKVAVEQLRNRIGRGL